MFFTSLLSYVYIIYFFNVLINLSATTDLPSLKVGYIIISLSDNHFLKT